MSIYTFWSNLNPQDGTAALSIASGIVEIGHAADFTQTEFNTLSEHHLLLAGDVSAQWTAAKANFPWQTLTPGRTFISGAGGSGGGGPVYTWKTPGVSSSSSLPASGNAVNDVRLTLDTNVLYVWNGSQWQQLADFGTGAGGGGLPTLIQGGTSSTTSFVQVISGGTSSTTSFVQVISGGTS